MPYFYIKYYTYLFFPPYIVIIVAPNIAHDNTKGATPLPKEFILLLSLLLIVVVNILLSTLVLLKVVQASYIMVEYAIDSIHTTNFAPPMV